MNKQAILFLNTDCDLFKHDSGHVVQMLSVSAPPPPPPPPQDVMVVGEPTLMGGEFGDEDERLITRLENTQYDATNGLDDEDDFNSSPALGNNAPWSSKPPAAQDTKAESTAPQPSQ